MTKEVGHLVVEWDDRLHGFSNADKKDRADEKQDSIVHEKMESVVIDIEKAKADKKDELKDKPEAPKISDPPLEVKHIESSVMTYANFFAVLKSNSAVPKATLDKKSSSEFEYERTLLTVSPSSEVPAQPAIENKIETVDAGRSENPKTAEPLKEASQVSERKSRRVGLAALRSQLAEKAAIQKNDDKNDNLEERENKDVPRPR